MGVLTDGALLSWEETKMLSNHVRNHGIEQFINLYRRCKHRDGDVFKWGDELEHLLIKFDDNEKMARLSLRSEEILTILNQKETNTQVNALWRPEYGSFMLESSPGQPYDGLFKNINAVETNMRRRRQEALEHLSKDEFIMTLTSFPRLGAVDFTWPKSQCNHKTSVSCSKYFPDEAINRMYPRFMSLTHNVQQRRDENIQIKLNVFKDSYTKIPVKGAPADQSDAVCMDAIGFGGSCCCLQVTFQARNVNEARILYDQLAPICPIMLALTAGAPAFRGYLVDSDSRWDILSASMDCRTLEERGEMPLKSNQFKIAKSRFSSLDSYLTDDGERYNDIPLVYDEQIYQRLRDGDVDHLLAQHVAQLFIRDPIVLLREKIHQNDEVEMDHFENIQSTNWRTMRLKPPPPDSDIGWRVEFRPCEIQLTDFENAAFACFMALLTRVILANNLNFLIPISKIDENMTKAQKRNAYRTERFWFRTNINNKTPMIIFDENGNVLNEKEFEQMTIDEIFNGNGGSFSGLISVMQNYLSTLDIDIKTHQTMERYMQLVKRKASGELLTPASWIRKEIVNHPEYKNDSIVTERINYDLLKKIKEIQEGRLSCADLNGVLHSRDSNSSSAPKKFNQFNSGPKNADLSLNSYNCAKSRLSESA